MRLIRRCVLAAAFCCAALPLAMAAPAPDRLAALGRGINITHWFRYPAPADDAAFRDYLSDPAIAALRQAGFSMVRLAVQPELLEAAPRRLGLLIDAVKRLQRAGLAVVVAPHPSSWHLEDSAGDRERLLDFWRRTAPALRDLPAGLTYPELLNEPVFAGVPRAWEALQRSALAIVRSALPDATVILTGADWGGIDGLAALQPVADGNVVYSIHFYEPSELTSLAAYRQDVDRSALAHLPFPMNPTSCAPVEGATTDRDTLALIGFTCGLAWDANRIAKRLALATGWAADHHAAIWLGEFGATRQLNREARFAWLRAVRQACEQRGIGWALWGYDDQMGFGIDPRTAPHPPLDAALRAALGLHTNP